MPQPVTPRVTNAARGGNVPDHIGISIDPRSLMHSCTSEPMYMAKLQV
jgi:hypothetical protein